VSKLDTKAAIEVASAYLRGLPGHVLDVLDLSAPSSPMASVELAKVVSKLSPMLGNLIESSVVEFLNQQAAFKTLGKWKRQDPGFPDAIFESEITPAPGFEIKAWFPLATEITARFKDSQNHFLHDQTYVLLLAWLPEHLIYGKPAVLDLCIVSGASVAKARDDHYHNPPDYLVVEPNDTAARTQNLQQTNTNGYKFQGTPDQFAAAERVVKSWGAEGRQYSPSRKYQVFVQELMSKFPYRLDTNFAKTDRIEHAEIEAFKKRILARVVLGMTIQAWARLLNSKDERAIEKALRENVNMAWR
jgi:hypothetical protein